MARSKPVLRPSLSRSSVNVWTEEAVFKLLAWAEHCRRKDGSGEHLKMTIVRHLQNTVDKKISDVQIDGKVRELAKNSKKPLSSLHYSKLYQSVGTEGMIHCVIADRAARKAFQCRVNELNNNESSKPTRRKTALTQYIESPCNPLRDSPNIAASDSWNPLQSSPRVREGSGAEGELGAKGSSIQRQAVLSTYHHVFPS